MSIPFLECSSPPPPQRTSTTVAAATEAMNSAAMAYAAAAAVAAGIPSAAGAHPQQQQQNSHQFYAPPAHFVGTTGQFEPTVNYLGVHYPPPPPTRPAPNVHQQPNYNGGPSVTAYPSLLYQLEPTGNERKIGLQNDPNHPLSSLPMDYRAQLAFHQQQPTHSAHYPPIGYHPAATFGAATGGSATSDWTAAGRGGDIYLRVGATLEIGTAAAIGGANTWNPSTIPPAHHQNPLVDGISANFPIGNFPTQFGPQTNSAHLAMAKPENSQNGQNDPTRTGRPVAARKSKKSAASDGLLGGNAKCYLCTICGRQYCRKSTLKAHMKHHIGDRPFNCQICGKHFSQAANLTAHQRVHTGEKPFCCPICHRPFSQSSSLVTHKRTHTGERPYPCPHCEKAFTDSSTLTKHLRTHTGQKPYSCALCMMKFSQSGNLHRHMKTHMNGAGIGGEQQQQMRH